jgi:hypothetical protein
LHHFKGYVILAPSVAEAGDLVLVLLDGQTLLILNRDDGQYYWLIGACYFMASWMGSNGTSLLLKN